MYRGLVWALMVGLALSSIVVGRTQAQQPDRIGTVRQWATARAQGNIDAALAGMSDGVWFMDGACLVTKPCQGGAAVRPVLQQQAAGRVTDTVVYARPFGSVVVGRIERRSDALRAAGVDRTVYAFIAQIPQDKISGWAVLPDLSDTRTARAHLGSAATPVPAFADRVSVDRRFADAVTRGDIETAVNIFADDGLFISPAGCLPVPCARPQIRGRLQALSANHAVYTFTNGQTIGSVVVVRFELRGDNFRAKGAERIVNVYIAQVPRGRIEAWIQFPDVTDTDTVKLL